MNQTQSADISDVWRAVAPIQILTFKVSLADQLEVGERIFTWMYVQGSMLIPVWLVWQEKQVQEAQAPLFS